MILLSKLVLILYVALSSIFPLEISTKEESLYSNENKYKSIETDTSLDEKNYIIGPGDIFSIEFIGKEEEELLNKEFRVIKTGKAYIPIIGEVLLEGLTYNEAYQLIKDKYSNELITPEFTLNLINARPVLISIVGEVRSPGIYAMGASRLQNESKFINTEYSRIVDALLEAGGLTKDSNIKNIELIRKLPKSKGGGYKKAKLDLYELVFNGNHAQNPILFDGDFISVSKVDNSKKLPETNFTNALIEVYVVGEVARPGKILIKNGTQLAQALYYAGGPVEIRGNTKKVELVRTNQNGSVVLNKYNLKLNGVNSNFKNPMLQDGDIVRVAPTMFSKTSDIIKATSTPVLNIFALYKIFE